MPLQQLEARIDGVLFRYNRYRYHHHERGFFRVNIAGWCFRWYDIRTAHWVPFSSRNGGWHVGPFIFRITRESRRIAAKGVCHA